MVDPALSHIISRLESDLEFLVAQNYLTSSDVAALMQKLPSGSNAGRAMPTPTRAPSLPVPAAATVQARALWAYNESGQDADDLSFREGDIIEVVREENPDWWLGRHNGKEALFPSAYVEKIAGTPPVARTVAPVSKKPYKPFMAAHHGRDVPPPAPVPMAPTNSIGLQQDTAGQQQNKDKYGKYKNAAAMSAAQGVGFGAGAAVGGGLVRAIF
ncbi:Myosin IE [Mycena chlorophos]|uniref:Myosin IE n=1 Tax=Mycena chlorophos TaxID=658473 RepID=A0A8H6TJU0_MYCCL|nr:Myosin IE [Mycena chlorophos]